jgi:superfamily II DNA/RNA helicase
MLILDEGDKLFENKNKTFLTLLDNALKYGDSKIRFLIFSATFTSKLIRELNKKRQYLFIQTLANSQKQLSVQVTR